MFRPLHKPTKNERQRKSDLHIINADIKSAKIALVLFVFMNAPLVSYTFWRLICM